MQEITVRVDRVYSPEGLHRLLEKQLHFPDYYGRNLDALWDMLGEIQEPTRIYWYGQAALAEHLGDYGVRVWQLMLLAAAENQNLEMILQEELND